jgi:hypothetical protein
MAHSQDLFRLWMSDKQFCNDHVRAVKAKTDRLGNQFFERPRLSDGFVLACSGMGMSV